VKISPKEKKERETDETKKKMRTLLY